MTPYSLRTRALIHLALFLLSIGIWMLAIAIVAVTFGWLQ